MTRPDLPADLRRFIASSVPSVPFLEAVLLLRAEPHSVWTVPSMARRLYLPEAQVAELLAAIEATDITVRHGSPDQESWMYKPATAELGQILDRLAVHYAADLVTVTTLIHSRLDKRAQKFADAFRWRKDT